MSRKSFSKGKPNTRSQTKTRTRKTRTTVSQSQWEATKQKSSVANRKMKTCSEQNKSLQKLSQRVNNSLIMLERRVANLVKVIRSIKPRKQRALVNKKKRPAKPTKSEASVSVDKSASMLSTSMSDLSDVSTTNTNNSTFFLAMSTSTVSSPAPVSDQIVSSPKHGSHSDSHSSSKEKSKSRSKQTKLSLMSNSHKSNSAEDNRPKFVSIEKSVEGDKENSKRSKSLKEVKSKSISKSLEKPKASSLHDISLDSLKTNNSSMENSFEQANIDSTMAENMFDSITEQGEDAISPEKKYFDQQTSTSHSTTQAVLMSASRSLPQTKPNLEVSQSTDTCSISISTSSTTSGN